MGWYQRRVHGECAAALATERTGCCLVLRAGHSQDDRDVPAQPGTDQWKSRQGRAQEIDATSSVHITALEKGKDIISCEGGAEGEGEGEEGGEFTTSSASA